MRYIASELMEKPGCKIVAVADMEIAAAVESSILESYPTYKTEINPAFSFRKKIGPFSRKNKTPIWKILMKSEDARKNGAEFLMKHVHDIDLYGYEGRVPASLSTLQRKRASILYDAMNGVCDFLINDCSITLESGDRLLTPKKGPFLQMIFWLKSYGDDCGRQFDLIWISDLSPRQIVQELGDDEFASDFYSVYHILDNKITALDKEVFNKEFQRRRRAKVAFEAGRVYDMVSGINQYHPDRDQPAKALPFYKDAAENGHLIAQFALGRLYSLQLDGCEFDEEKALYWCCEAAFNEEYDDTTADPLTKECRERALAYLKPLVVRLANGKDILRKYMGDQADAFIQDAKREIEHEKQIQAAMKALDQVFDHDRFRREMDEFLGK